MHRPALALKISGGRRGGTPEAGGRIGVADLSDIERPAIGVICGSDAIHQIVRDQDVKTGAHGNNDSGGLLMRVEPGYLIRRLHLTPGYFRQPLRYNLKLDLIWNTVSDEEQNPKVLAVAQKLIASTGLPVVNPPAMIPRTSRVETAKRLAGIDGVIAPKVLLLHNPTRERVGRLAESAGFRFPAIVRRTGTHAGEIVGIFPTLESLEPIFGDRKNDYFMIEYVDVRHSDGLYRKTRFFMIGDRVVTRQHIVSDQWLIHGRSGRGIMSQREDLLAESRTMLIDGFEALPSSLQATIHGIRERMGLDYIGLDCCLREDGRIVLFECNATMNFNPYFRNPAMQHNRAALPRYLDALQALVTARSQRSIAA